MMLLGGFLALLLAVLLAAGAGAWIRAGRPWILPRRAPRTGPAAEAALRRHPAGRARGVTGAAPLAGPAFRPGTRGPDDDPDFIRQLERQIRGGRSGEET